MTLAAGDMGEVYRARDTRLERTVAVKVLPSSLADSADRRAGIVHRDLKPANVLLTQPKLLAAARADFEKRTGGQPYRSPIPAGQKPPVP